MKGAPLRVLCIDHEGGHGGSSRSLYQLVRHMDRRNLDLEVWCGRSGVVERLYAELGIPCRIVPGLPRFTVFSKSFRDNLSQLPGAVPVFWRARSLVRSLAAEIADRFDAVHFNHPSLFLLARWLRRRCRIPFVMHVRTRPPAVALGRWQGRMIVRTMDRLVFITENERQHMAGLAGIPVNGAVIYNIHRPPPADLAPHPLIPRDERLKVASLSNYSWARGVDRLVDVAAEIAAAGRRTAVLFVMAGDMRLTGRPPGELGAAAAWGGSLADHVRERGLDDMFLFLGHVPDPERVLAGCDLLTKLTREANPWGRDIIEALAQERPVMSCGDWTVFVETGETGFLYGRFEAGAAAGDLLGLIDDREACRRLGRNGAARMRRLCDGPARAGELLGVWTAAANARQTGSAKCRSAS